MAEINCRHFSGYKPCGKSDVCDPSCPYRDVVHTRLLIIHLEALGAVLRATSILPAIKRKFANSHITWITQAPAECLLQGNPYVDKVLTLSQEDILSLSALEFDAAFVIDKSLRANGVLAQTKSDMVFGFVVDSRTGAIVPASTEAEELWQIGLNNSKKFFENAKPETQLLAEALELNFRRDAYVLELSKNESDEVERRRLSWRQSAPHIVGINTGCSGVIPYKKMTVEKHRELIFKLQTEFESKISIVLLGGKEDAFRNMQISNGLNVVNSPFNRGLRDGVLSVAACDTVITGDSLGMHLSIALEKWTVAWFGPTCSHEIDLYDRGVKILSAAPCGPCWKRTCHKPVMCYDQVDLQGFVSGVKKGIAWRNKSLLSKQHFLGTSSSPSR